MSGTSLDGLDIAFCEFKKSSQKWKYKILKAKTFSYSFQWKNKLANAHKLSAKNFLFLHNEFGNFIGKKVNLFLSKTNEKPDFIASHGHTIFHQPDKKLTFQLGSGAEIAATTNIATICDFRTLDVALKGQGAPLVPIGDELLFNEFDFCINIGGFANLSYSVDNQRIAYDIGPANIILNYLAKTLGQDFDEDGNLGKQGIFREKLFQKLNEIEYFSKPFPKSLSREWLENQFIPVLQKFNYSILDVLRTIYEHIAFQISRSTNFENSVKTMFFTGGGTHNSFLMKRIEHFSKNKIVIPDKKIIDFKEALIFAFLGVLRLQGEINCLKSVTNAGKNHSGGIIFSI